MSKEIKSTLDKALLTKSISKLQFDVYQLLLKIPRGKVTTYKIIAKFVKCNSFRAVGQVLKKNAFAPEVPCHRVIRSDLTLGGFTGSTSNKTVEIKFQILKSEGIEFDMSSDQFSQAKVKKQHVWEFNASEP